MAIEYLYPTGAVVDDDTFFKQGATTNYECIDDPVGLYDNDATCIYTASETRSYSKVSFTIPDYIEQINSVTVYCRAKLQAESTGLDDEMLNIGIEIDGQYSWVVYIAEGTPLATRLQWTTYSKVYTLNPFTNNYWQRSDLINLRGVCYGRCNKYDGKYGPLNVIYCTQLYLEIDYSPVNNSGGALCLLI